MSDIKAPERVWLIPTEGWGFIQTQEKPVESLSISIEYVRADLASRSALTTPDARAAVEEIYQAFVSVTPDSGWTGQSVRDKIVAIISSHCGAASVPQPSSEAEAMSLYNEDGSYTPVAQNIWNHSADEMRRACVNAMDDLLTLDGVGGLKKIIISTLEQVQLPTEKGE